MRVHTDDEVYRVDAVWLGPPKATFPWRARYVAYGVGIPIWLGVFAIERKLGFDVGFFVLAWSLVITVALTRWICSRISHERPLGGVIALALGELNAPTPQSKTRAKRGSALSTKKIRVSDERPRPRVNESSTESAHASTQGERQDGA